MPRWTQTPEERFWSKVNKLGEDECWEWQAHRHHRRGYGVFKGHDGKLWQAHRWLYAHLHGSIPEGMLVCHECDNPPCVNPNHLFLGTNDDNMEDMKQKGRANGPRGESCHLTVLNEEQVREILRLQREENTSSRKLAAQFGVGRSTIQHILHNESWRHISREETYGE